MGGKKIFNAVVGAFVLFAAVAPTHVSAASAKFGVSGRVNGDVSNVAVLVVGYTGASMRIPVAANGTFKQSVPSQLVSKFMTRKAGKGPTIHLLKNGMYAGPVLLRVSGAKGYTRLSAKATGTVSLGAITLLSQFAKSTTKKKVIDLSRTVRVSGGAPVSALSLRNQVIMGPVHSFDALTTETSPLGADADKDGLPNFADADLNGDGVLDAAQPGSTSTFSQVAGVAPLTNRAVSLFAFAKILEQPWVVEVNSNANPNVTLDQVRSYLTSALSIEMSYQVGSGSMATTSVLVDCRKLAYCSAGSTSMIRGAPGEAIDGKSLVDIQNELGLIVMPQRLNENMRLLRFYPGEASATDLALTGDVFELIVQNNGTATFSEVRVVTSSVVTPMAFATFNGSPASALAHMNNALPITSLTSIPFSIYRPQTFSGGTTNLLKDRGGLTYEISVWPENGSNTSYQCNVPSLSGLSATLKASTNTASQQVFDTEQMPEANGVKLGFTLDATKCASSTAGAPVFTTGAKWRLEIQSEDSDSNKARIGIIFVVP